MQSKHRHKQSVGVFYVYSDGFIVCWYEGELSLGGVCASVYFIFFFFQKRKAGAHEKGKKAKRRRAKDNDDVENDSNEDAEENDEGDEDDEDDDDAPLRRGQKRGAARAAAVHDDDDDDDDDDGDDELSPNGIPAATSLRLGPRAASSSTPLAGQGLPPPPPPRPSSSLATGGPRASAVTPMRHVGLARPAAPTHVGGLVWARTPAAAGRDPLLGTESGNEDGGCHRCCRRRLLNPRACGSRWTRHAWRSASARGFCNPHGPRRYGLAGIARRDGRPRTPWWHDRACGSPS